MAEERFQRLSASFDYASLASRLDAPVFAMQGAEPTLPRRTLQLLSDWRPLGAVLKTPVSSDRFPLLGRMLAFELPMQLMSG